MSLMLGVSLSLLTAGCWAHNSIVYSLAGKRVSSETTTHIRLWVALPLILITHTIFFSTPFPLLNDMSAYIYLAISGFVGFFLADLFIFKGFVEYGPKNTMVILTISPILSAVIAYFALGELITIMHLLAIIVTLTGINLVIREERKAAKELFPKGFPLSSKVAQKQSKVNGRERIRNLITEYRLLIPPLLGALGQAIGVVFAKKGMLIEDVHPISANTIRLIAGFIGIVGYFMIQKRVASDFRKMKDLKALFYISFGAFVGPIIGIVAALYAVKYAPVAIVSTIMQSTPVILVPVEMIIFKRKVSFLSFIGTLIAVGGIAMMFL